MKKNIDTRLLFEIGSLVSERTGVRFADKQTEMLKSRIYKRMLDLKLNSLEDYKKHIDHDFETEIEKLISILTTHHTYFFREFTHFEYIQSALPKLAEAAKKRGDNKVRVWAAACSRGQEVYSLAMWMDHLIEKNNLDIDYEILASDVDKDSVLVASNGVYLWEEIKEIPMDFIDKYWARGKEDIADFAKAKKNIKSKCQFKYGNLVDFKTYPQDSFDIIFCRNVFIYFDSNDIKKITSQLMQRLSGAGLLFLGISESLHGLDLDVKTIGPSIYSLKGSIGQVVDLFKGQKEKTKSEPIRVLCVDDSKSIHTILKSILTEDKGYKIVGHAMNGKEAHVMAQKTEFDIMTLDIHMPDMTGTEYLKTHFNSNHPPVIMLTSVSRENLELAQEALDLGASDYIEKPTAQNIKDIQEQLFSKMKMAMSVKKTHRASGLDKSFSSKPQFCNMNGKLRVFIYDANTSSKMKDALKSISYPEAPIVTVNLDEKIMSDRLTNQLKSIFNKNPIALNSQNGILKPDVFYCNIDELSKLSMVYKTYHISFMVFANKNQAVEKIKRFFKNSQILVDESVQLSLADKSQVSDVVPVTSFGYLSDDYLCKAS